MFAAGQQVSLGVPFMEPPPTAPMRRATPLTLMPSNRDRARRGRRARKVRSDLMGPISAKPRALATRLISETCGRQGGEATRPARDRWQGSWPTELRLGSVRASQ